PRRVRSRTGRCPTIPTTHRRFRARAAPATTTTPPATRTTGGVPAPTPIWIRTSTSADPVRAEPLAAYWPAAVRALASSPAPMPPTAPVPCPPESLARVVPAYPV